MVFHMAGYDLWVEVKDEQGAVDYVLPGHNYGHIVRTTEYLQIIPTDVVVTSALDNTDQLQFRNGPRWTCTMHFEPDEKELEMIEPLHCVSPKVRDRDKIKADVVDVSKSQQKAQWEEVSIWNL